MRYALDCEFSEFNGYLISLALVPEDKSRPELYMVFQKPEGAPEPCEWVQKNVVPILGDRIPISYEEGGIAVGNYLRLDPDLLNRRGVPQVIADWPEDITLMLRLSVTGPGVMLPWPDCDYQYRALRGFNTADHSKIPHNALEDARALRDYLVAQAASA